MEAVTPCRCASKIWFKMAAISQLTLRINKMKRTVFFCLLAFGINLVNARSCVEISEAEDRLACFDIAGACTGIHSATARLECFDSAYFSAPSLTAVSEEIQEIVEVAVDAEPSPAPLVVLKVDRKISAGDPALVPTRIPENFGRKKSSKDPVEYIEGTIVEVKRNSRGIDYIRLDNGQIWRENTDNRVRFEIGQRVRIEKGVLNSFNLRVRGVKKLIKVRRTN